MGALFIFMGFLVIALLFISALAVVSEAIGSLVDLWDKGGNRR